MSESASERSRTALESSERVLPRCRCKRLRICYFLRKSESVFCPIPTLDSSLLRVQWPGPYSLFGMNVDRCEGHTGSLVFAILPEFLFDGFAGFHQNAGLT